MTYRESAWVNETRERTGRIVRFLVYIQNTNLL